jgi:hypothetical protein
MGPPFIHSHPPPVAGRIEQGADRNPKRRQRAAALALGARRERGFHLVTVPQTKVARVGVQQHAVEHLTHRGFL